MIGIGVEELGVEEFVEGKFFDGDLYIDQKKESFSALGFKRIGFFSAIGSIFTRKAKELIAEGKQHKMGGNMKGDALQNGGTVVIASGGKILLSYIQEEPADHVDPAEVLKALGIQAPAVQEGEASSAPNVVCDADACRKA